MSSPFELFKWQAVLRDWRIFADGLFTTMEVAILALIIAIIIGVAFGIMGTSRIKIFIIINRIYVEFFQNTPLVIQIFFLYNGLPYLGIVLSVFTIGIFGVGIYHGAYISEVVKSGINSIPKGQMEAGLSQGFTRLQVMRYIILPQAIKIILPPLTNQAVSLIKNTSILAMIAGGDLMYNSDSWSAGNLYYGPAYVVTGLLYFALCYPLATLSRKLEGNQVKTVKKIKELEPVNINESIVKKEVVL